MASQGRQSNARGNRGRGGKPPRGEGSDAPSKLTISQLKKLEETQLEKLRKRFLPVGSRIARVRETMPIEAGVVVSEFEFYDSVADDWISFSEASDILRAHVNNEEKKALDARSEARFGAPFAKLTKDQQAVAVLSNREYATRTAGAGAGSPASAGPFSFATLGAAIPRGQGLFTVSQNAARAAGSSISSSSSAQEPAAPPPQEGDEDKDAGKAKASGKTKGS